MGNNDFNSSISAKISANEAIRKIGHVPVWWGVTFTGSTTGKGDFNQKRKTAAQTSH